MSGKLKIVMNPNQSLTAHNSSAIGRWPITFSVRTQWCTLAPHIQYEATTPNPRCGEAAANVKGGFSNFQLPRTFAVVHQSGSDHHPPPYLGKLRPHAKFHENPTVALRDRTFYPPIVHDIKNLDTRAGPTGPIPWSSILTTAKQPRPPSGGNGNKC